MRRAKRLFELASVSCCNDWRTQCRGKEKALSNFVGYVKAYIEMCMKNRREDRAPFLEKLIEVAGVLRHLIRPAMKPSPEHWNPIGNFADLEMVNDYLAAHSATFGPGQARVTMEAPFGCVMVVLVVWPVQHQSMGRRASSNLVVGPPNDIPSIDVSACTCLSEEAPFTTTDPPHTPPSQPPQTPRLRAASNIE